MSMRIGPHDPNRPGDPRRTRDTRQEIQQSQEKLASGKRINRAADDAAGLAAATRLGQELEALQQGMRNLDDGVGLVLTADGDLGAMADDLHRMRELAMGAASGLVSPQQRGFMNEEFSALKLELDRASAASSFGGTRLLDGSAGEVRFTPGREDGIALDLSRNFDAESLGLGASRIDGSDATEALMSLEDVDQALRRIGGLRAELGGVGDRLVGAQRDLAVAAENAQAARSRIMDADDAKEKAGLTRQMVLARADLAVRTQARGISNLTLGLLD